MYGVVSRRNAAHVLGIVAVLVVAADHASGVDPKERPALRSQPDAARGRLWTMTRDGVDLYDVKTGWKLAQIALPGWIWVGERYACPPALAIGPRGEAVITSNVVPTLWRVDAVTLVVSQHDLVLDEDKGRDIGFTGLVYSARQRTYYAVSAMHGSLWRIDPLLKTAQRVPLPAPLPKTCG